MANETSKEVSKLDNKIYYSICEVTVELMKETDFTTHKSFCGNFKDSLNTGALSDKQKKFVINITKKLEKIYSLTIEEIASYIVNYFIEQEYLKFEKSIKLFNDAFKNSVN
jgi:replication initiation and membrane attachment protein DnaB